MRFKPMCFRSKLSLHETKWFMNGFVRENESLFLTYTVSKELSFGQSLTNCGFCLIVFLSASSFMIDINLTKPPSAGHDPWDKSSEV